MRANLLAWQWADYADKHASRANVALHLVVVPMSWAGAICMLGSPLLGWPAGVTGIAALVVSLAVQGRGHAMEAHAPTPFSGPDDFVSRFVVEQFITFPRFVASGNVLRVLRGG